MLCGRQSNVVITSCVFASSSVVHPLISFRSNTKRVVQYHTPNPISKPEEYAHHLMMLFLPFRKESDLCENEDFHFVTKLNEPISSMSLIF